MKFWRSPFFYFCLVALCLTILLPFFIGQGEKPFSLKRNIFDESQYLFSKSEEVAGALDLNIIGSTVLGPSAPPFLVSGKVLGALAGIPEEKEIEEYIVEKGDNSSSIAQKFGISLETLLWANDLSMSSIISPGQKLIILPVSGLLHVIREGDTLSELSQIYQAKLSDIVAFNGLSNQDDIFIGDLLIIPGGKMPSEISHLALTPVGESYFIFPCEGVVTQGPHGYRKSAIDVANECGKPVVASASGVVQRAGYLSGVGGKRVTILHLANGVVTYYGHLSTILVWPGQKVTAGDIIGKIGNTGYTLGTTGCHVHFEVRGAKNFLAKYPVGTLLKWGNK